MAIAYRSGSTAGNASGGNLTITKPTGTADGDILVAVCYNEISAAAWTAPAGWAQWGTGQAVYNANAWINAYWKRAASEGASWQFNISTTWRVIAVAAFSGALATGDPIDVGPTGAGANDTTPAVATQTTITDNAMMLALHGNYNGAPLTGIASGTTLAQGPYLGGTEIWYAAKTPAGASGATTWTHESLGNGQWASYHLAIKPAAAAATSIKKVAGVEQASIKVAGKVALASIKKMSGVSNVS